MDAQRISPGWCLLALAVALVAGCGGDSEADKGGMPSVRSTVGCTAGATTPCSCATGAQGTQRCQLDGTLGACNCSPAAAGGPAAIGGGAGVSAASAVPPAGVGPVAGAAPPAGRPTPPAGGAPTPPPMAVAPKPVIVPPEDVKTCMGMGLMPGADEEVEVLKIRTSDAVPGGFKAPGGTYYGCFWVEIDMPEKRHIIGWEGAVGDRAVHHQQVSLGAKPVYLAQQGGLCGLPSVEYTWTGERPPEWTPSLAGYPIGGPENGGKARFLWQTHFESPTMYMGGFNAYVTKKLRKYDGGNFEQGDVRGINIPPKASYTHTARCTPEMTKAKLIHPIYVYASMLHAHLTVKKIKSEHFRNGMLLNTLGDATTNGFLGFFDQSFKPHTPCIEIQPGDELVTTCEYQNPWDFAVTGGEATNQEMCTIFMQYFPRLPKASDNFCGTIDATGGFTGN